MLTALGAAFFLLGLRFALLRWRELAIAEGRIQAAVRHAEEEVRCGVSGLRLLGDYPAATERLMDDAPMDEGRIVQARSDPPGPSP
jgi:hypothetical protein